MMRPLPVLPHTSLHLQVWWPWANAVWGELQYALTIGILWENLCEPCSFGLPRAPRFPIGQPLPPQPPQPARLGIDRSLQPCWQVDINVHTIALTVESRAPPGFRPGAGPALGMVSSKFSLLAGVDQLSAQARQGHFMAAHFVPALWVIETRHQRIRLCAASWGLTACCLTRASCSAWLAHSLLPCRSG